MKKRLVFKISSAIVVSLATGAVFWACRHDRPVSDPNTVEPTLTVGEARDFFEYQFSEMSPLMTKTSGDRPVGMLPGDFTPLWDKARIGANREMDGADVPIDPKFIFVAVFNRINEKGDTVRRTVDVVQKLVVKKWRNTEEYEAFCYIASIVPTPEYYARHKNIGKEFQYAGSKGDFSGFVVYQTLDGIPAAITSYQDGNATRHEYFPRVTKKNADSVATVMDDVTGAVSYLGGRFIDFEDDVEKPPLVTEEVKIIAERTSSKPWLITLVLQPPRPTGLPVGVPNPSDITYNTPYVPSGGGGGIGSITTSQGKPTKFDDDCSGKKSTVKTETGKLHSIIQQCQPNEKVPGSISFAAFQQRINSNPAVEHSANLEAYIDLQSVKGISICDVQSAPHQDSFVNVTFGQHSIGMLHSHPTSHQSPPSPLDAVQLGNAVKDSPDMQASFVFVGNDVYCLQITDFAKAKAFAAANPIQEGSSMFTENSPAGKYWKDGWSRMNSMNSNDQYCATMAYVLGRSDAGIMLLRMEAGKSTFEAFGVTTNSQGKYYPTRCR